MSSIQDSFDSVFGVSGWTGDILISWGWIYNSESEIIETNNVCGRIDPSPDFLDFLLYVVWTRSRYKLINIPPPGGGRKKNHTLFFFLSPQVLKDSIVLTLVTKSPLIWHIIHVSFRRVISLLTLQASTTLFTALFMTSYYYTYTCCSNIFALSNG